MATVSIAFGSVTEPFSPSFGVKSVKPLVRRVLGTLTVNGTPSVRTILLLTTYGALVASTTSAADGTFSFTVSMNQPLLMVGVGSDGEQPVAHTVTPGV